MLRYTGHSLILIIGALFVFHSPFSRWWSEIGLPWYSIYLFWLVLIVLVALDNIFGAKQTKSLGRVKTNDSLKDSSVPNSSPEVDSNGD